MAIVQPDNVDVQLDVQEDNSCGLVVANFESMTNDAPDAASRYRRTDGGVCLRSCVQDANDRKDANDRRHSVRCLQRRREGSTGRAVARLHCRCESVHQQTRLRDEWTVEFSSHKEDDLLGGAFLLPLVPSHTDLYAVQVPDAVVLNIYIVDLPAPTAGVPYARVAAVNAAGLGATSISSPSSVQPVHPSKQLPGKPADVKIQTVSPTELRVEWEMPSLNGGLPVHSYKVEWDSHDMTPSLIVPTVPRRFLRQQSNPSQMFGSSLPVWKCGTLCCP